MSRIFLLKKILLGVIFFLFLLVVVILSVLLVKNRFIHISFREIYEVYEYQSLRISTDTNETSFGYVSIHDKIIPGDFLSFIDGSGNNILISNFGDKGYKCTGKCYCENNENDLNRRSSSILLSRSVTYLLVAVSSLVAYRVAEDFFERECVSQISDDSCALGTLKSEIDECELVFDEADGLIVAYEEHVKGKFFCRGKCMTNTNFEKDQDIEKNIANEISTMLAKEERKCGQMSLEVLWDFDPSKYGFSTAKVSKDVGMLIPNRIVTVLWAKHELDRFCRAKEESRIDSEGKEIVFSSCCGYDESLAFMTEGKIMHENTKCRKLQNTNAKKAEDDGRVKLRI